MLAIHVDGRVERKNGYTTDQMYADGNLMRRCNLDYACFAWAGEDKDLPLNPIGTALEWIYGDLKNAPVRGTVFLAPKAYGQNDVPGHIEDGIVALVAILKEEPGFVAKLCARFGVTPPNPLLSDEELLKLVEKYAQRKPGSTATCVPYSFPDGSGIWPSTSGSKSCWRAHWANKVPLRGEDPNTGEECDWPFDSLLDAAKALYANGEGEGPAKV